MSPSTQTHKHTHTHTQDTTNRTETDNRQLLRGALSAEKSIKGFTDEDLHTHANTHARTPDTSTWMYTWPDIMNCLMGTVYTFQCGANTGGRTFSQRETEGKQSYLCSPRTDSSPDPDSSADTNTVPKQFLCKQQNTLHNATHNAPLSTDC